MPDFSGVGKLLIIMGLSLVLLGGLVALIGRWPAEGEGGGWLSWLGRLPGDLFLKRDRFTFYFPLATSLVISVVLSLLLILVSTLFRR